MYNICLPVLYRDIVTDNFPSFAAGLRTNENIDHTARLHINHQRHWYEEHYQDILTSKDFDWDRLAPRIHPGEVPSFHDLECVKRELLGLVKEGTRIRQFITEGLTILPRLRTVSIGGFCGDIFNDLRAPELEWRLHADDGFEGHYKTLPHALLDLPTVRDYCQALAYGPLSLPNRIIKPDSPITSYTIHQRGTPMFCSCRDCFENHSPPIILGAINRYYCDSAHIIPSTINPRNHPELLDYLKPILAMFTRPDVIIADPNTGTPITYQGQIKKKVYQNTTVEIYNYVRILNAGFFSILNDSDQTLGSKPPQPLAFFQESLDQALPEVWKGRVRFINREEAPDCKACGFNPQEVFLREQASISEFGTGHCAFSL